MTRNVPWRRLLGLKRLLAIVISTCLTVLLFVTFLGAYWLVERETYRTLDITLVRAANELVRQAQRGESIEQNLDCRWLGAPACTQVTGADGQATGLLPVPDGNEGILRGEDPPEFFTAEVEGVPMRLYTEALPDENRTVTVGFRAESAERSLERTRWLLLAAGAAGALMSAVAGYLIARMTLKDLRSVTRTAELITAEPETSARISMPGHDELARLSGSFDAMVDALQGSMTSQQRLVSDASHELRTPLTAIQANAELLRVPGLSGENRERAHAHLQSAVADMTGLVADIVDLARGVEADPFVEPVRLDILLAEVVHRVRSAWPTHAIITHLGSAVVTGNPERLERLFGNLIVNAVKFSPAASPVEVTLTVVSNRACVTIRDDGPGVAEDERDRIFDRFYRSPATRRTPGSGLGLALAQQVAAEHGTRVQPVWPHDGGTEMSVTFVVSEPDSAESASG